MGIGPGTEHRELDWLFEQYVADLSSDRSMSAFSSRRSCFRKRLRILNFYPESRLKALERVER